MTRDMVVEIGPGRHALIQVNGVDITNHITGLDVDADAGSITCVTLRALPSRVRVLGNCHIDVVSLTLWGEIVVMLSRLRDAWRAWRDEMIPGGVNSLDGRA